MKWPQIVMVIWMFAGFGLSLYSQIRNDKRETAPWVMFGVVLVLVLTAFQVLVLHEGGFW